MKCSGPLFAVPIVLTVVFSIQNVAIAAEKPYWVEPMKTVHAGFRGNPGYVARFGDSITYSIAFWTPIGWDEPQQYLTKDDGLPKRPEKRTGATRSRASRPRAAKTATSRADASPA